MYEFIRGILTEKEPSTAIVEAAGIGYSIQIPLSTYQSLPACGTEIRLLLHFVVREDAHLLIGFISLQERELFRQLIGITAIGPKVALNILSKITVADFIQAILTGDVGRLKSTPGVGAKTAERLIIELKGKLKPVGADFKTQPGAIISPESLKGISGIRQEAFDALLVLGYVDKQIIRALERVAGTLSSDAPVEDWIRKALQVI